MSGIFLSRLNLCRPKYIHMSPNHTQCAAIFLQIELCPVAIKNRILFVQNNRQSTILMAGIYSVLLTPAVHIHMLLIFLISSPATHKQSNRKNISLIKVQSVGGDVVLVVQKTPSHWTKRSSHNSTVGKLPFCGVWYIWWIKNDYLYIVVGVCTLIYASNGWMQSVYRCRQSRMCVFLSVI